MPMVIDANDIKVSKATSLQRIAGALEGIEETLRSVLALLSERLTAPRGRK